MSHPRNSQRLSAEVYKYEYKVFGQPKTYYRVVVGKLTPEQVDEVLTTEDDVNHKLFGRGLTGTVRVGQVMDCLWNPTTNTVATWQEAVDSGQFADYLLLAELVK